MDNWYGCSFIFCVESLTTRACFLLIASLAKFSELYDEAIVEQPLNFPTGLKEFRKIVVPFFAVLNCEPVGQLCDSFDESKAAR